MNDSFLSSSVVNDPFMTSRPALVAVGARALTAVPAFLAGALAGGRLARREDDHDTLRQATAVQAALIAVAVVLAATLGSGTRPGSELLGAAMGVAMGPQNAAVRRIGAPDLTTTVLTMTLTGFAADSKAAGGEGAHPLRKVAVVGAMLAGAFAGGLLQLHVAMWTALSPALVLVLGVLGASHLGRNRDGINRGRGRRRPGGAGR